MKKRLLSLFLVLAMLVSFTVTLPVSASAVENDGTEESNEPVTDINEATENENDPVAEENSADEPETDAPVKEEETGNIPESPVKSDIGMYATDSSDVPAADGDDDGDGETVTVTTIDTAEYTITVDGTYKLSEGLTSAITVAEGVKKVTIIGNGVVYNSDTSDTNYSEISNTANIVTVDCSAAAGINLTIQDLYNSINASTYSTKHMIDFAGTGNVLTVKGTCVLDYDINFKSNMNAGIHVTTGTELTINGDGTLYIYKNSQGAGIGGATGEVNGKLTLDIAKLFIKGTKQGAVIGAGSGSSSTTDVPGAIIFNSGIYNIITNSRGAAIGGSAGSTGGNTGTTVTVNEKATLSINSDYSGAAVGGGGYAQGNDSSGGTLTYNGGSIRPYVDKNAANSATTGWNGKTLTEGVNDAIITAKRVDSDGNELYFATVDLSEISAVNGIYTVTENIGDGESTVKTIYTGSGHSYVYAYDGVDRTNGSANVSPKSIIGNWIPEADNHLYFYLTGEDHTLTINGTEYKLYWNELFERFDTELHAVVTFNVTPNDADIVVSDGIVYTYVENTYEGVFFKAVEAVEDDPATEDVDETVEAQPAVTKFSLPAGNYTATITKSGYFASQFSFKVTGAGLVTSITTSSNVKSYLDSTGTFTIPLTVFTKSTNTGAWDGVTLDVSWYSETAKEMYISTPAQLAGMAAIVNGIYNAEITTIIDDVDGDSVTETYTPREYAALSNRKIIAACSSGDMSGANGNNLVTTNDYWYGAKSTGTYGDAEIRLPSDFNGQTVYITADLDMGGYQTEGKWTGARYMPIGGQWLTHYIDYSTLYSDGYSHMGSSFNGKLDGQGHIVKNIYCNRYANGSNYGDSQSIGLIGRLGNHDGESEAIAAVDPTVRNVAVTGYIYGRRSVGGIVGKIGQTSASKLNDGSTGGIIENCLNFCYVGNTDAKGVGGICGAAWNSGVIRNCINYGAVHAGRQNCGGIGGSMETLVENCLNVGYVNAVDYNHAQAIGTNNGGAVFTNVYWLTGSSLADSYDDYQYPAVHKHSVNDTLTEITSFDALKAAAFLTQLNGNDREFVFASETDAIYSVMSGITFENCKLETSGVTAAGMPVPRVFTNDTATITKVENTSAPTKLAYVEGQEFDTTGLEIWASYSDNTKELVTDYSVSVSGALTTDITKVTVYGSKDGKDFSYDFEITVAQNEVNEIKITTAPANMIYASNETFDVTGLVVKAYYANFPKVAVTLEMDTDYTYSVVENKLIVSYTFNGKTVTAETEITLLDTPAPTEIGEGAYVIASANDLLWFANQVNALKKTELDAVVTADITAPESFKGIGKTSVYYAGTFDGGNHTITVNLTGTGAVALFPNVGNATIKNTVLAGSIISTSGSTSGVGGFVAYSSANTVVENCVNNAEVTGCGYVGGILGKAMSKSVTVTNCTNNGVISSSGSYCGGIGAYLASGSVVTGCVNTGNVTSTKDQSGGIAGYINGVTITNCGNSGKVSGTHQIGGIVGNSNSNNDKIISCYNIGNISGSASSSNKGVGGIVGVLKGQITNAYNLGTISFTNETAAATLGVGGIAGVTGSGNKGITNVYSVGKVTSASETSPVGVLVGYAQYNTALTNCYYLEGIADNAVGAVNTNKTVTGEPAVKTADEIKALASDLGDGFKANNTIVNNGYPVLEWQTIVEYAATIGDTEYDTVAAALAAAQSGETVKLAKDASADMITVFDGVTLDLNGKTLTATYVFAVKSANVIDSVGDGLLKVSQGNIVLSETNSMIPAWNTVDGYIFDSASIVDSVSGMGMVTDAENDKLTFKFVTFFGDKLADTINGLLTDNGAEDNDLSIVVRLEWNTDNGTAYQSFVYNNEQVKTVIAADGKSAFTLTVNGYKGIENLKISAMILSDTSAQLAGTSFTVE